MGVKNILLFLIMSVIMMSCGKQVIERARPGYFEKVNRGELPALIGVIQAENMALSMDPDSLVTYWDAVLSLDSGVQIRADVITINPGTNLFESGGMIGRVLSDRVELLLPRNFHIESRAEEFHKIKNGHALVGDALVTGEGTVIQAPEIQIRWKD